jgi:hypothetical protein
VRLDDQAVVVLWEGLPLVWEQLPEVVDWMAHDAAEYIVKVLPGIDVARLAGLDQAEKKGRGPCAAFAACKKPVLPAQAERPDGIFRCVVVGLEPAVAEIATQGLSLVESVINGLAQGLRGDRGALEFLKPGKDGVNDRCGVELPALGALNRIKINRDSSSEANANATVLDLAGWNKLNECARYIGTGLTVEPPAPGVEALEVDLVFFAERGRTHAALGLALDESLPLPDTLFSGHGTPSQSLSMDCLGYHSWPEARCKGG